MYAWPRRDHYMIRKVCTSHLKILSESWTSFLLRINVQVKNERHIIPKTATLVIIMVVLKKGDFSFFFFLVVTSCFCVGYNLWTEKKPLGNYFHMTRARVSGDERERITRGVWNTRDPYNPRSLCMYGSRTRSSKISKHTSIFDTAPWITQPLGHRVYLRPIAS